MHKSKLRKKVLRLRAKEQFKNNYINFNKIFTLIKNKGKNKKIIGGYFPVNNEIDDLMILNIFKKKGYKVSLPLIKKEFNMNFFEWQEDDPLKINKLGIPEPTSNILLIPDILLVPLVAYDKNLNRLGYGGGYYDRFIQKLSRKKKVLKIGLAFSIQKINKVPITKYDQKLDFIVTEKNII